MSKIQIVIEVGEKTYADIMYDYEHKPQNLTFWDRIIANGIPLPKGHGDLIDRNEVEKLDDKLCIMECAYCTLKHCFYHEARPIIKADKAESEE